MYIMTTQQKELIIKEHVAVHSKLLPLMSFN